MGAPVFNARAAGPEGNIAGRLKNGTRMPRSPLYRSLASDLYSGDRGIRVPFFNRPAMFPSGPSALALKTGAPILPVWCRRQTDNLYIAEVEAPIEVSRTGDTQRDIQVTTERIVQFFERIIRREPDQWLVFLPVWRTEQAPQNQGSPMQPVLDPS